MANLANTVCYPDGREPPNHVLEGVFQGMSEFSGCAWHGMHTAIKQPMRYAAREGLFGAGKGIIVGALGFAESLADGALDMASYVVEGVRNTPDALADYVVGEDRLHYRHLVDRQEGRMLETYLTRQPQHLPDGIVLGSKAISSGLVGGTSTFVAKNVEAFDEMRDVRGTVVELGRGVAQGVVGFTVKASAASLDFTEAVVDGARNTPDYVRHSVQSRLEVGRRLADRGFTAVVSAAHKAGALERAVKEQGAKAWQHRPKLELAPIGAPAPLTAPPTGTRSGQEPQSSSQPPRAGAQRATSPMGRTVSEAPMGRTEAVVGRISSDATVGRSPSDGVGPPMGQWGSDFRPPVRRRSTEPGPPFARQPSNQSSIMGASRQGRLSVREYGSEDSSGVPAANQLPRNRAGSTTSAPPAMGRQPSAGSAGSAALAAPEQIRTVVPPAPVQAPQEVATPTLTHLQPAPATVVAAESAAQTPAPVALSVLPAPSQPARPEPVRHLDTVSDVTVTTGDRESVASPFPTLAGYVGLHPRGEWEMAAAQQFAIPAGMVFPHPAREPPRRLQSAGFGAQDTAQAQAAMEYMQMYADYQPGYALPRESVADGSVSRWR